MKKVIIYALVALGVFTLIISNLGTCSWGNTTSSSSNTVDDTTELITSSDNDTDSNLGEDDFDDEDGDYDIEDNEEEKLSATPEDSDITVAGKNDETDGVDDNDDNEDDTVVLATNTTSTSANGVSSTGKYLVVTGSFRMEENAQALAKKLKKRGYSNAEVVIFDYSEFYSVVAGRSSSEADAANLRDDLLGDGIESYVHKMRSKFFK